MKKPNYLVNGLAALAFATMFSQCAGNANQPSVSSAPVQGGLAARSATGGWPFSGCCPVWVLKRPLATASCL